MCIVIDINTFHSVFDENSERHLHFRSVLNWIINGKGKIVCGGTKYFQELEKLKRYIKLFNQLKKSGKVVFVDDHSVDSKEKELKELCKDSDFDDPHIVALLIESGCKLICSEDVRSYPYIKRKEWFPKGSTPPKIFCIKSSAKAQRILSDHNIAEICLPCVKLSKEEITKIPALI
ncbi:hypothetical protein [Pseudomonas gingeri]